MSDEKSFSGRVNWAVIGTVIVALITAAATMTVGYWQYHSKNQEPENSTTVKEFRGRVVDENTGDEIQKAKITLEAKGAPPVIYSDSEGYFSFPLDQTNSQVRIRVSAKGYEKYDRFTNLSSISGVEEIRIHSTDSLTEPAPISDFEITSLPEQSQINGSKSEEILEGERPQMNSSIGREMSGDLNHNLIAGDWIVIEKVKPEQGGYNIIWLYTATVRSNILTMEGRKTRVNDKEPTSGEKDALSVFRLVLDELKAGGKFEEKNYRDEILQGNIEMFFDSDLTSLHGSVFQGGKEIATFTGSKQ
jgi:hypothetical protein